MKKIKIAFAAALIVMTLPLTSCFKDEPLNAEADIEKAYIHLDDPSTMFFNVTDTLVNVLSAEDEIIFHVRQSADISNVALNFEITDGATISPANGSHHDFESGDVTYTVTSQDGKCQRHYKVHFNRVTRTVTEELKFDFEHFEIIKDPPGQYYIWHNTLADGSLGNDWTSGNGGFKLSLSQSKPDEYPTYSSPNGLDGACVVLVTRDTGPLGPIVGKPIAAGNMFLGKFDTQKAMNVATILQTTRFGIPFDLKPVRMTGYYKYHPGALFIEKQGGKIVERPDRVDVGDIYAVFYRNHDSNGNSIVLFGDNVLSSDQIVAIARIEKTETTNEWTAFDLAFEYKEEVDQKLLEERGYSLTIVFSSSIDGASFAGAIGSDLMIDKVRLYTEIEED